MSNNPGRPGKPAPWMRRAEDHKHMAERQYLIQNHVAYAQFVERRHMAARGFSDVASEKFPAMHQMGDAEKMKTKLIRQWDKANDSPMSFEEHQQLKAAFKSQYVAPDFT